MNGFLEQAVAESRRRVAVWRGEDLFARLEPSAPRLEPNAFSNALRGHERVAIIAEIKRASPSRGILADEVDPAERANAYVRGGASAVSVLTESRWFRGSLDDLASVRRRIDRPILRKDFIVDEYDLAIGRALGANAALLIVAALERGRLRDLLCASAAMGLESLVEVRDHDEAEAAIEAGARIVGVNARNLRTLELDPAYALAVLAAVPRSCVRVFESSIKIADDVRAAARAGADAVLVGETLMRAEDPAAKVRELLGG